MMAILPPAFISPDSPGKRTIFDIYSIYFLLIAVTAFQANEQVITEYSAILKSFTSLEPDSLPEPLVAGISLPSPLLLPPPQTLMLANSSSPKHYFMGD